MPVKLLLILCLTQLCGGSLQWFPYNIVFKSKSIIPIPIGVSSGLSESITKGAEMALKHCQEIFKWDKWNCPTPSFFRLPKQRPTKETAFSKAILAAGVVYFVTKSCATGSIPECGCDSNLNQPIGAKLYGFSSFNVSTPLPNTSEEKDLGDWRWGGCSEDPTFALDITAKLLDGLETGNNVAGYVGRHNYRVGREIIWEHMKRECTCHEVVSGNCSLSTCWMTAMPFEDVVRMLKVKYRKAQRSTYESIDVNSARLSGKGIVHLNRHSLVYLVQSPDYCLRNPTEGHLGTKGRRCSRTFHDSMTKEEKRSCRNLCKECGYKVRKRTKKEITKSGCEFVWCCDVTCDIREIDKVEYFCD